MYSALAGTATLRELSSNFSDREKNSCLLSPKDKPASLGQGFQWKALCKACVLLGLAGWVGNPETPAVCDLRRTARRLPLGLPEVFPSLPRTSGTFSRIPSFYQAHCSGHKAAVSQIPKDGEGWAEAGSTPVTMNICLGRQCWLGPLRMGQSWPK